MDLWSLPLKGYCERKMFEEGEEDALNNGWWLLRQLYLTINKCGRSLTSYGKEDDHSPRPPVFLTICSVFFHIPLLSSLHLSVISSDGPLRQRGVCVMGKTLSLARRMHYTPWRGKHQSFPLGTGFQRSSPESSPS